ncbi:MAG: 1-phosphofructokinase [Lachnospiraceae bacterium]
MIYTVTLNPSLDHVLVVKDYEEGTINQIGAEYYIPGGKGINVSSVCKNLGVETIALGFIAGFSGMEIKRLLDARQILNDFILIDSGNSRLNVKILSQKETQINGEGPFIQQAYIDRLLEKLSKLTDNDVLVLSGSIPPGVPNTIYRDIMKMLASKNITIFLDAIKEEMWEAISMKPFCIKPNKEELGDLFGVTIKNRQDCIFYGKKLREAGARNVLISLGEDGAILLKESEEVAILDAPTGKVVHTVGAGDSMVAGFLCGYLEKKDMDYAFKLSVCAGSASSFSQELAPKETVDNLLKTLENKKGL